MSGNWLTGWVTGDVPSATEFKKMWGSISDTTLGSANANVDITGIPSTYAHLMLCVYARGDTAATFTNLNLRFNGDTAANYDSQVERGSAATVAVSESFAQTSGQTAFIAAGSATTNLFSAAQIVIPHYAGTTSNKTFRSTFALKFGTASTNMNVGIFTGFWRSNAAINEITVLPTAGNLAAGTRVTLYAMGA